MMLKPQQRESVKCMYKGKDVFLWLPTGFGKLICYEVLFCAPEAIVCGRWRGALEKLELSEMLQ